MLEILLMNQQTNGGMMASDRLSGRLRDNYLLGGNSEEETENEGSQENSLERSYDRTNRRPEDFVVEENELSRSQMMRQANKGIIKSEL